MSNWFERCECGEYVNVKHECIYNDKDLMIQHLQDNESVSNTLKPCPFCGSKAKLFEQNLGFSIVCQDENLLCNVRLCYCNSEEEALQVWNRRVI